METAAETVDGGEWMYWFVSPLPRFFFLPRFWPTRVCEVELSSPLELLSRVPFVANEGVVGVLDVKFCGGMVVGIAPPIPRPVGMPRRPSFFRGRGLMGLWNGSSGDGPGPVVPGNHGLRCCCCRYCCGS